MIVKSNEEVEVVAIKITQNNETKIIPEAHEIDKRIKSYGGIFSYATVQDFPISGLSNLLYKAEDTNNLYSWDAKLKEYKQIGGSTELPQIKVIFGGTSEDTEDSSN
jgi:hypothetical protein